MPRIHAQNYVSKNHETKYFTAGKTKTETYPWGSWSQFLFTRKLSTSWFLCLMNIKQQLNNLLTTTSYVQDNLFRILNFKIHNISPANNARFAFCPPLSTLYFKE